MKSKQPFLLNNQIYDLLQLIKQTDRKLVEITKNKNCLAKFRDCHQ